MFEIRTSIIQLYTLLAAAVALGFIYSNKKRESDSIFAAEGHENLKRKENIQLHLICAVLIVMLTLYCGMRTAYNDTFAYIRGFMNLSTDFGSIDWKITANPGFVLYQIIIKRFISDNFQWFLLITATITISLNILFIRKYAPHFAAAVFLYITSGLYIFAFAAVKQSLATAIVMLGIEFARRRQWRRFYLVLFLAITIHTFAFVFVITPFFIKSTWDNLTYGVLGGTVLIGAFFGRFIQILLSFLGEIDEYYTEDVLMGGGVSIFRVAVFAVPVFISWLYRDQIKRDNDPVLNLCTNFTVISFAVMFISLFGNPILFGRIANYFQPFFIVTLTTCLFKYAGTRSRTLVTIMMVIGYSLYFYMSFERYKSYDNFFEHASFAALFQ